MYIFLDESGDLGFSINKSSKYFLVTILATKDKKKIEKRVKKVFLQLKKRVKRLSGGVLHAYKEKPATRRKLLELLNADSCKIMLIILNKSKVYTHLKNEKHILYNYVINILFDRIMSKKLGSLESPIIMVAAKRETNKFLNLNFKAYLQNQVESKHKIELDINIKSPAEEKALQAVDFVSWACFRKYEFKDEEYYLIIKEAIVEENWLYK